MKKHPMKQTLTITLFILALFATHNEIAQAGKITKSGCAGNKPQSLVKASNGVGAYMHP